jgi:SAM-dependent methyltransferase
MPGGAREKVKDLLRTALPEGAVRPLEELARTRHLLDREYRGLRRRTRVSRAVLDACGWTVQHGPFKGLRFPRGQVGTDSSSKCIGSYEKELHADIERLLAKGYRRVVNIGCADGYYAVGLARRLPEAQVYAYDLSPESRAACSRMAMENDVAGRLEVRGECTPEELDRAIVGRTLVVMDCEGCEVELLRPDAAPALAGADVVVELHDFVRPGTSETILGRMSSSHDARVLDSHARHPGDYPELAALSWPDKTLAVFERPMTMQWAVLESRRPAGSGG